MPRLAMLAAATAALAAGLAGTAAPANAAALSCSEITLVAATGTPYVLGIPHDIADVATASATCTDLQGGTYNGTFVFEWYYSPSQFEMPACPTTQSSTSLPANSSSFTVEGHATCQRPGSSPASTTSRWVKADLWVNGVFIDTTGIQRVSGT